MKYTHIFFGNSVGGFINIPTPDQDVPPDYAPLELIVDSFNSDEFKSLSTKTQTTIKDYVMQYEWHRQYEEETRILRTALHAQRSDEVATRHKYQALGWDGYYHQWSEQTDSRLIGIAKALDKVGLSAAKITRSLKLQLIGTKGLNQKEIFDRIYPITGDLASIRFSTKSSVWIQIKNS